MAGFIDKRFEPNGFRELGVVWAASLNRDFSFPITRRSKAVIDCTNCPFVPMPLPDLATPGRYERSMLASRNTPPGNLLDRCGVSLLMQTSGLPTGLQFTMPLNHDARLLVTGRAIERVLENR